MGSHKFRAKLGSRILQLDKADDDCDSDDESDHNADYETHLYRRISKIAMSVL